MKIYSKIVNFLNAIIVTIGSLFAMMSIAYPDFLTYFYNLYYRYVLTSYAVRIWTIILFWVLLVLSVMSIASLFKKRKLSKGILKRSELGECQISFSAMEDIANAEARRINGIKVIKTPITKTSDGVSIEVRATACMDENIPELSSAVQERVKNAVEKATDIKVSSVKVQITEVYVPNKPRVE